MSGGKTTKNTQHRDLLWSSLEQTDKTGWIALSEGLVVDAVGAFLGDLGWSEEDIIGHRMDDLQAEILAVTHPEGKASELVRTTVEIEHSQPGAYTTYSALVHRDTQGDHPACWALLYDRIERTSIAESSFPTTIDGRAVHGLALIGNDPPQILFANEFLETLTGYSKRELQNMTPKELGRLIHDADKPRMLTRYRRLFSGDAQSQNRQRVRILRRDGKIRWIEGYGQRVDYGGKPAVEMIFVDITDLKRTTDELRNLETRVHHTEKIESLGMLAQGLVNDFSNLLTGILGSVDLALKSMAPTSASWGYLLDIKTTAERASSLSKQMMTFAGKMHFRSERMVINDLIQDLHENMKSVVKGHGELVTGLDPNLPAIEGDPVLLRQVLMNLVANAAEAIDGPNGAVCVKTLVKHCDRRYLAKTFLDQNLAEGIYVVIEVTDNGSGMDDTTITRIFDPFFTTKMSGSGLGLPAVLGIVRGHGGGIAVDSTVNQGTTFEVILPVQDISENQLTPSSDEEDDELWQGAGTVLLVDDEHMVRDTVAAMLEHIGFKVISAYDGRHAIELFERHSKDIELVLLDVTMPHMAGEDAYRILRSMRSDVPIVVMSGYSQKQLQGKFADDGVAAFIQKPFSVPAILKLIRRVLEER